MPTLATFGDVCARYASTQFIHGLSRHIGSQPFVPALSTTGVPPSFAGQSRIVAFEANDAGAADIAIAIFCALVIVVFAIGIDIGRDIAGGPAAWSRAASVAE